MYDQCLAFLPKSEILKFDTAAWNGYHWSTCYASAKVESSSTVTDDFAELVAMSDDTMDTEDEPVDPTLT